MTWRRVRAVPYRSAVIVWAYVIATYLLRVVPVHVAHRLVAFFTPPALLFAPGHLRRALENMRQVLGPDCPPREVWKLTLAAFANYGRYMVDLVHLPLVDAGQLARSWRVVGLEHLHHAYEQGKGVVFVTGHIGNWDMGGAALAAQGVPVSVVVESLKPVRWNERVQRIREQTGMRAIPIERGIRDMLATLRRNEGLAILVDRPVQGAGVPVRFFGRQTQVPGGAATLALRTGSPIVPAVLVRERSAHSYVAHIGEPIQPARTGDQAGDVQRLTQQVMAWLEGMIRRYPDQWYMFRSMWPTDPPVAVAAIADAAASRTAAGRWRGRLRATLAAAHHGQGGRACASRRSGLRRARRQERA